MPYSEDGSDVPARIKGKKKRRQWAHVWNSIYQQTGDEGRAFAGANSVTSKVFADFWNALEKTPDKALNVLYSRLVKADDTPFPDTGEYDEESEDAIRAQLELWADYAEDGPTYDPKGKYLCGDCSLRRGDDDCATVVSPINFETGSCRTWDTSDSPIEELPVKLTQIEAAYTERPNVKGFGCARCMFGGGAKKADGAGRTGWCSFWGVHVFTKACCFKNTGDDDVFAPVQKSIGKGNDMSTSATIPELQFRKFIPLIKVDEDTHTTYGLVTSETPDKEDEICDYEGAKKAYQVWSEAFLKATAASGQDQSLGNVRIMHGLEIGGKVVKLEFKDDKKEIWLATQPKDDNVWKLIKGGFITGLSQGGRYAKKEKEGEYTRYTPVISEVSYVDNPAHPDATFTWVKADGSMEIKKFAGKDDKPDEPELKALLEKAAEPAGNPPKDKAVLGQDEGIIPNRPITNPQDIPVIKDKEAGSGSTVKLAKCGCTCPECMGDNHAGCTAATKCNMSASAKAVKYLVTDKDGKGHLPYTREDGKPNHRLMGAAWAALHNGYRGNKYAGPDKSGALKRLKQIYAKEGLETPAEKAFQLEELLKDVIQGRAYGRLNKGMYTIARFSSIIEDLKWLWMSMEFEREEEGDESAVVDDFKATLTTLLDHLLAYTEEQIDEEKECLLNRSIESSYKSVAS